MCSPTSSACSGTPTRCGRVLEIGGPDVVTYEEMMQLYADVADLRPRVVMRVPVLSPRLSSYWVGLVTPLPFGLARPLVDSLVNEVVVHDDAIERIVPRQCLPLRRAIELALARTRDLEVTTSWAEAELDGRGPADPLPSDPSWSGGIVLDDTQTVHTQTPITEVWSAVCGVGGDRGWPAADALWEVRGIADRLLGGPGMRRGRRHPCDLRVGDAVDFFRVEAIVPERLLRLRAEMKVPGAAWLEWTMDPEDGGTRLVQKARFHPRGVWGRTYWYAMLPFHHLIFQRLATALADGREQEARRDTGRHRRHDRCSLSPAPLRPAATERALGVGAFRSHSVQALDCALICGRLRSHGSRATAERLALPRLKPTVRVTRFPTGPPRSPWPLRR